MCLALYKPAKATLSEKDMRQAFINNPDGAGFAYYDPAIRRVVIQKGYYTFNEFWKDFKIILDEHLECIVHFRWATHGEINDSN